MSIEKEPYYFIHNKNPMISYVLCKNKFCLQGAQIKKRLILQTIINIFVVNIRSIDISN